MEREQLREAVLAVEGAFQRAFDTAPSCCVERQVQASEVLVTGATGFLGKHIVAGCGCSQGWRRSSWSMVGRLEWCGCCFGL